MPGQKDIERLRELLGVGAGRLVYGYLATADAYFRSVLGVNPLEPEHLKYVRGIDFHRPVTTEILPAGTELVRFPEIIEGRRQAERRKAYRFFSVPGATPAHLGWNPEEAGYERYQTRESAKALVSFASGIRFSSKDSRSRLGGDRQVVVPWHTPVELVHEREFDRQNMAELFRAGYLPLGLSTKLNDTHS